MVKYFVTIFGIGYSKFAPGTLGSLCGVLSFFYFYNFFSANPMFLFFLIFFIFVLSWYFIYIYVDKYKIHDPSEIIIDEFLGQLLSLTPLLYISNLKLNLDYFFVLILFSLFLFRFFDILKPWPINIIDQSKTSFSILMDDMVAGLFSAIILFFSFLWLQKIY